MTESSPVATIRGTCFYALCLISRTPQGADALLTHGWTSIRHSSEEKWPLILSEAIENVIKTPASPLSPTTSFSTVIGGVGGDVGGSPSRRRQSSPSQSVRGRGEKRMSRTVSSGAVPSPRNYILRPVRPMDLGDIDREVSTQDSPTKRSTGRGVSVNMTRLNSLSSLRPGSSGNFVGVVLPLELSTMFKFKENTYEGSRADYVTTQLFDDEHHFLLEPIPNTASPDQLINDDNPIRDCGGGGDTERTVNILTTDDNTPKEKSELDDKKILGSSVHSHTSVSSGSTSFDENSYEGQLILHREFLEIIYYLCSDVSLRKNVLHLNLLCNRFPCLTQDSSLYWKTMTLLSLYNYTQVNRRLIQSKFENLTFEEIFTYTRQYYQTRELLKDSSSSSQSPGDATSIRRHNSTGELLKSKKQNQRHLTREESSRSEEKLDAQSMKSIATTTTASELDTLSEGSMTSNEMLEWEVEGGEGGVKEREGGGYKDKTSDDQLPSLAEAGNRLSQLDLDTTTSTSMPPSIVEVVIDL